MHIINGSNKQGEFNRVEKSWSCPHAAAPTAYRAYDLDAARKSFEFVVIFWNESRPEASDGIIGHH